ncbi:hypothetical protein OTU49_014580, partial [Cherax quadricarinatus]
RKAREFSLSSLGAQELEPGWERALSSSSKWKRKRKRRKRRRKGHLSRHRIRHKKRRLEKEYGQASGTAYPLRDRRILKPYYPGVYPQSPGTPDSLLSLLTVPTDNPLVPTTTDQDVWTSGRPLSPHPDSRGHAGLSVASLATTIPITSFLSLGNKGTTAPISGYQSTPDSSSHWDEKDRDRGLGLVVEKDLRPGNGHEGWQDQRDSRDGDRRQKLEHQRVPSAPLLLTVPSESTKASLGTSLDGLRSNWDPKEDIADLLKEGLTSQLTSVTGNVSRGASMARTSDHDPKSGPTSLTDGLGASSWPSPGTPGG